MNQSEQGAVATWSDCAGSTPKETQNAKQGQAADERGFMRMKRHVYICYSARALLVLVTATVALRSVGYEYRAAHSNVAPSSASHEDRIDRDLSIAVASALGNREGVVLVMDPRTGRVRAVANPQLAFEKSFAPGSTIKPFSTLAALRLGKIDKNSRILCREHLTHEDFKTVCSHPRSLPPLKPAEALAYSCNYYFGKLGEQLRESSFNSTLSEFGFGQPSKIHRIDVREASGKLPHGQWRAQIALGEGAQLEVTPIQLLTAYSALVNGGHLLAPQIAPEAGFVAQHHRELSIDDEHRQLILDGMRGAVRYGTAERARLHSLPLYVYGKTGTATPSGGFRTHGWFVGFASGLGESATAPENTELAILVFLKRAHGSDAAELARPILEAYIQATQRGEGETAGRGDTETRGRGELDNDPSASNSFAASPHLGVSVSSSSRVISLEDYILGVVAAEGSTEMEDEAIKALAITSRTYAVKNLRRHAADGYDFCTTTHCQRFLSTDHLVGSSQISSAISPAVTATAGYVLQDKDGRIVDSYFSASCGGATANISTLWGVKAPSYLIGGSDEYCLTMPHHSWRDVISTANLLRALESDPRTEVGGSLTNVSVTRRDASGRAELITIEGARRRTVKGWDFKIVVGRALGWNLLKSSRFEISRSRSDYVFRGSGFGHGLGLCQEGAHVMARRGASHQQILAKYFPGTRVSPELTRMELLNFQYFAGQEGWFTPADSHPQASGGKPPFLTCELNQPQRFSSSALRQKRNDRFISLSSARSVLSHHAVGLSPRLRVSASPRPPVSQSPRLGPASRHRTLSSEHFRLRYPARLSLREVEYVLQVSESHRADLIRRVSSGSVLFHLPTVELFINESTGDFAGRTGQPPWVAAATLRNRIELQPLELLVRRRILETTIRHELVHAAIDVIGRGRTPRWLSEGLALHVAGEGPSILRYLRKSNVSRTELENRLSTVSNAEDMRIAYAAAYLEVKQLISVEGEATVWRRVGDDR